MPLRTKKILCRSLFLLLGLVPLFGTVGFATWRHVVFDQGGYQTWIAGQLGVDLRVQQVSHPLPDVIQFSGANIVDPESGELLASCDSLKVTETERLVELHIPVVNIPDGQFRPLLDLLHERLLRQSRLLKRPISVDVDEVTLGGGEMRLIKLHLDAEHGVHGPLANLTFGWADRPETEVRLHLVRDQRLTPAVTRVELLTPDSPLPCSLLFAMPDELSIGDAVTFQGNLRMVSGASGWTGDFSGKLSNLEFQGPQQLLTGIAEATVRRAEFEGGWMRHLEGRLHAQTGHVDRQWMTELINKLELDSNAISAEADKVSFDELGIDFRIVGEQALLSGVVGSNTSRVMLANEGKALVGLAKAEPIETIRLFRALFRLSDDQVPVSTDQSQLLRMLPLP